MNGGWLLWLVQCYKEKRTHFLNTGIQPWDQCVTATKKGTFQEPQNNSALPSWQRDMLASCAGLELHTVGLELLLIGNDYQTQREKDRRQTTLLRSSPSLGSRESAHLLTAPSPYPRLLQPMTASPPLPPPDSRSSQFIRKQTLPGTVFQES